MLNCNSIRATIYLDVKPTIYCAKETLNQPHSRRQLSQRNFFLYSFENSYSKRVAQSGITNETLLNQHFPLNRTWQ